MSAPVRINLKHQTHFQCEVVFSVPERDIGLAITRIFDLSVKLGLCLSGLGVVRPVILGATSQLSLEASPSSAGLNINSFLLGSASAKIWLSREKAKSKIFH